MNKTSKPYKSIEQRLFVDSGIKDFLADFSTYAGKTFYGTVATMFRAPTTIRKYLNGQTLDSKTDNLAKCLGMIVGGVPGALVDIGLVVYSEMCLLHGLDWSEYEWCLPALTIVAANALFGVFELGRLPKSRQENLEFEAQQEAQRIQTLTA